MSGFSGTLATVVAMLPRLCPYVSGLIAYLPPCFFRRIAANGYKPNKSLIFAKYT